jgi:hypothetical protein
VKPDPNIGYAYAQIARGTASYNALMVTLNRRFVNGLQFLLSYAWSKSMDLFDADNGAGVSIYHPHLSWAPAGWDRTHNLQLSGVYVLPIGPGQRFLRSGNLVNKEIVGGWQLSEEYQLARGEPLSMSAVNNVTRDPYVAFYATKICDPNGGFEHTSSHIYNAACFAQPATGQFGIGGRAAMRNPRLDNLNLGLTKVFPIVEGHEIQFRADAFSVFNHPNFVASSGTVGTPGLGYAAGSKTQRLMQVALRYIF